MIFPFKRKISRIHTKNNENFQIFPNFLSPSVENTTHKNHACGSVKRVWAVMCTLVEILKDDPNCLVINILNEQKVV